MIEKMKKYQFLIYHKDYHSFLLKLREMGVVHVTTKQIGNVQEDSTLADRMEKEKRYHAVIKSLNEINKKYEESELVPADKSNDGLELLENVETLFNKRDFLTLDMQGVKKEIERLSPLGEFTLSNLDRFNKIGWFVHFFTTTESKFDPSWIDEYNAIRINTIGSQIYFLTFTKEEQFPSIEAEHIRMPLHSIVDLKKEVADFEKSCSDINEKLKNIAKNDIETLRYQALKVRDMINFEKVELSGDAAAGEKLMILEGYIPVVEEEQANKILQQESLYFTVDTPNPKDNPPIKLKNNRFAKAFEMIADLYDRPNYNAFDLTPFFAPFYVVFFGLCLGDSGYGLIILLASFFLRRKEGFLKSAGQLATYLGIGTMIFGFISGTFFGIELLKVDWAWIEPLRGIIMNPDQLFIFALIMGGIQITYAMIIKAITSWMRFGFLYSLDTFGWLITLFNGILYFATTKEMIEPIFSPTVHAVIAIVAGCMMLFFNNPQKGIKGIAGSIGSGLFGLYNKVSGLLGDMLSYIRLFALGISGSVMGLVFNQLAIGLAPDTIILKQLVMILILLFGHGINIFINGLGAFIHPMRLTFVEFYNNAGFDGGGKAYQPFKSEAD